MTNLETRLAPFLDAGLLHRVPTPWQVTQGELEMALYVISTDVTDESAYRRGLMGQPIPRQLAIAPLVGLDHFRIGTGLGASLASLCTHLQFTFHRGMPVWDLQLVQTHPGGLDALRASTEELLASDDHKNIFRRQLLARILTDPNAYLRQFVDPGGYIDRAEHFEYETPSGDFPAEFHSVTQFMDSVSQRHPATPGQVGSRLPAHAIHLATRRLREQKSLGWFTHKVTP